MTNLNNFNSWGKEYLICNVYYTYYHILKLAVSWGSYYPSFTVRKPGLLNLSHLPKLAWLKKCGLRSMASAYSAVCTYMDIHDYLNLTLLSLGFTRTDSFPFPNSTLLLQIYSFIHSFVNKYLVHSIYEIKIVKGVEIFKMPPPYFLSPDRTKDVHSIVFLK